MSGQDTENVTRVLYNADCPICSFEIEHYRRVAEARDLPLQFDDLNGEDLDRWNLDADSAARRLHVAKDGQLLSGAAAFRALWAEIPHTRWLARLTSLPGLRLVTGWVYDRVAAPLLYRAHRRRQARRETS